VSLNIIALQLPLGVYSLIVTGTQSPSSSCLDCLIPNSSLTLGAYWGQIGFMEVILGATTIYFLALGCAGEIGLEGIRFFQFALTILTQIKCTTAFFVYFHIIMSDMLWVYSRVVVNCLLANLYINSISFLLGIFLLFKFYHYVFEI
jgi:hypothetical protein